MYDVYSKFDITQHSKHFINYLEIVISPNGEIYYAVPSHTMFLENLITKEHGEKKFYEIIEHPDASHDYAKFLCDFTGYCLVWNDFYICGEKGLTAEQRTKMVELSSTHYTKTPNKLYQGEIDKNFKSA